MGVRPGGGDMGVRPGRGDMGVRPGRGDMGVRPGRGDMGVRPGRGGGGYLVWKWAKGSNQRASAVVVHGESYLYGLCDYKITPQTLSCPLILRLSARLFVLLGLIGGVMSHLDF